MGHELRLVLGWDIREMTLSAKRLLVRTQKRSGIGCVRIVTVSAGTLSIEMHVKFRLLSGLDVVMTFVTGLLDIAGDGKRTARLRSRRMTLGAVTLFEGRMLVCHQQPLVRGGVRIVTGRTIGGRKVIAFVNSGELRILRMAIETQLRNCFGKNAVIGRSMRIMAFAAILGCHRRMRPRLLQPFGHHGVTALAQGTLRLHQLV